MTCEAVQEKRGVLKDFFVSVCGLSVGQIESLAPTGGQRRLKVTGDDYQFSGGLGRWRRQFRPKAGWPRGRAAADDHQTAIPKTDERVSRDRKRDEQCHEGGDEPPDRAQVFAGCPSAGGTAGQAHLANARGSAGGDLAPS